MIEEGYVSLETARLLRKAGFREHCRCMYFLEKKGSYKICQNLIGDYDVTNDVTYEKNLYVDCYLAPTQALAARWLREVHRIVVYVAFISPSVNGDVWQYFVEEMDKMVWIRDFDPSVRKYATYEEAMEAGLQEAIKLIKK